MSRACSSRRGLTLIELLIALALGAMVLIVAGGLFSTAVRVRDRAREISERIAEERTAQRLMRRDLHQVMMMPEESGLPFLVIASPVGGGSSDVLQFVSYNADPLAELRPTQGLTVVQYRLEQDPETGISALVRLSLPPPLPQPTTGAGLTVATAQGDQLDLGQVPGARRMVLLNGVTSLLVSCFDPELQDWAPEWIDTTRVPPAVRIDVAMLRDATQAAAAAEGDATGSLRSLQIIAQLPTSYNLPPDSNLVAAQAVVAP